MAVELEHFVENEKRLRTVEEAIIKMEQILEVVLVDLKDRVRILEKHDAEVQNQMHSSCDMKSKEIDEKCDKVKQWANSFIKDRSSLFFKIVGSSLGLGILFIIYSSQHISALEANQKVLIEKLDAMDVKLDKATAQRFHIRNDLQGAK